MGVLDGSDKREVDVICKYWILEVRRDERLLRLVIRDEDEREVDVVGEYEVLWG